MGHLAAGWAKQNSVDVVLIVPHTDLAKFPLGSHTRSQLTAMGVRLVEVDWVRPPLGPGIPKYAQDSWCVNRDLFKLHVLGLDYDAVVFYDNDILVAPMDGDALFALFKCARQGYFLATALHGGFEPLAAGFFAVQPSPALLRAVLRFLLGAEYDEDFGWNMKGFGPWGCLDGTDSWCFKSAHVGAECGQGLMYNLFFMADRSFTKALQQEAGAARPMGLMLDGCIWLHENSLRVEGVPTVPNPCQDIVEEGRCSEIVAYHDVTEGRGCITREILGPVMDKLRTFRPADDDMDMHAGSTVFG
ncbi:unnamed protein product [Polarella glacialis]|uniref:Hexosyltransferase n=1 Tax=Polarella glacialis TaxID=89957 RepID=A0A813I2P4_POLGL|nr:unnamed protein product [Polarella glacialis]